MRAAKHIFPVIFLQVTFSLLGVLVALPALQSAALAQDSNAAKARELVDAAIKMTDSTKAVKLLWQATDIDPGDDQAYVYLGVYYQSKEDFDDLAKVYQKLVKYKPAEPTAWINVGEAYMSFSPPKAAEALPYYRKAYELDPTSSFAALRMGEIMAQQGDRDQALRYLHQASADRSKNPNIADEAQKILTEMGAS